MKCSGKLGEPCNNEATVFLLAFGNKRSPYCDLHKGSQKVYPIELYGESKEALLSYKPPPKATSKNPTGWRLETRPPSQKLIALKDMVPLSGPFPVSKQFVPTWHVPFEAWHIEDMIYPRYTAMVMRAGLFATWIQTISKKYEIELHTYSFEALGWNRDPLLRTMKGPSLTSNSPRPLARPSRTKRTCSEGSGTRM
ncbi:hypothetical protein [Hyalangium versicolor]|uniref:hypothetical protein n=1 Tax=Hyalangium versicolor TaxID=2861190 RepID=UPI001CCA576A|nr:hypothetical protein [Hyalangium versicolor]